MFGVIVIKTLATFACCRKKKEKHIRKTLRVSVLFVIWLTVAGGIVFSDSPARGEISLSTKVIVDNGDTLWGLAIAHAPRGTDVRDYLDKVLQKNGLTSALIYPGQEIILP